MSLQSLQITNVRCIQRAELEFAPGLNVISGANGSGKTSILETIFLLGRGRSFRTRATERLIRAGAESLSAFGRIERGETPQDLGVSYHRRQGLSARVNRRPIEGLAELSTLLPVHLVDPGIHRLIEDGPLQRRRWVDWGMFHVEPGFLQNWSSYTRALRQRNAALRQQSMTSPWDTELARIGEALANSRRALLERLEPIWRGICERLLPGVRLEWAFHRGWSSEHDLGESLRMHEQSDRMRGVTSVGAHRFDVTLKTEGGLARDVLSRGQQKLLGASLVLAMAQLDAEEKSDNRSVMLVDDPAAELDQERTRLLLNEIGRLKCQLIVTTVTPERLELSQPEQRFHVEQGSVQRL
jgi:DNA replication and repair protein RecF